MKIIVHNIVLLMVILFEFCEPPGLRVALGADETVVTCSYTNPLTESHGDSNLVGNYIHITVVTLDPLPPDGEGGMGHYLNSSDFSSILMTDGITTYRWTNDGSGDCDLCGQVSLYVQGGAIRRWTISASNELPEMPHKDLISHNIGSTYDESSYLDSSQQPAIYGYMKASTPSTWTCIEGPPPVQHIAVLTGMGNMVNKVERWLRATGWEVKAYPDMGFNETWITTINIKPKDEFIFYYAGHGITGGNHGEIAERNGSNYFTIYRHDGSEEQIQWADDEGLKYENGDILWDDQLTNLFRGSKWDDVKKMFILDACFSGGFLFGGDGDLDDLPNARLIASSREDQLAQMLFIGQIPSSSILTGVLRDGIHDNLADTNGDGVISFAELQEWVDANGPWPFQGAYVLDYNIDPNALYNGTQTPFYHSNIQYDYINAFGMIGDFGPGDCDVDGSDLAAFIADSDSLEIVSFAMNFGRNFCQ